MIGGSRRTTKALLVVVTALVLLAAAAAVNVVPSAAQEPPAPIASEPLTARSVFTDEIDLKLRIKTHEGTVVVNVDDPSRTVVLKYTVQPGARFPWHSHAGPVVVNIISGTLTYVSAHNCSEKAYAAGEAFVDPGQGHVHSAYNSGTQPTVFIATFFDAPAEGSLLIPAAPASC